MKVKKSLLIVPALGTMLLAAAGSVGGTVAWFSATTTFETSISTFKVVRLDGDLSCQMKPGTGTAVNGETGIKVATGAELTHGSFNHTNGKVCVKIGSENRGTTESPEWHDVYGEKATIPSSDDPTSPTALPGLQAGTYTDNDGSHTVYYAVTWFMTFTYQLPVSASTGNVYNLYLDTANSVFTESTGTAGAGITKNTYKGFRIAFYPNNQPKTATNTQNARVWADDQVASKCSYVSATGASTSASSAYASPALIDSANTTVIAEGSTGSSTIDICLGQFSNYAAGASTLGFTCVAWFEGTDENVVNASTLDTVSTSLAFYTRANAA